MSGLKFHKKLVQGDNLLRGIPVPIFFRTEIPVTVSGVGMAMLDTIMKLYEPHTSAHMHSH